LRERKEDIIAFTEFLLKKHTLPGVATPGIMPSLRQALLLHRWPGNIRELENLVRRFIVLRDPELIATELSAKATRKPLLQLSQVSPIGSRRTHQLSVPV
jgi:DNA-binding NtrC family response regulator